MWRENRDYAITVQGDVTEGLQGATVTAALLPALKEVEAQWRTAGQGGIGLKWWPSWAGLVAAAVLTLLALPAMYAAWFRVRRPVPEVA